MKHTIPYKMAIFMLYNVKYYAMKSYHVLQYKVWTRIMVTEVLILVLPNKLYLMDIPF